ncbi:beta-ketoacyl-ACP synthase 3 [Pseudomonas mangiferae]|uniref:Beta-ketoacyl-ACP synthase 3 n=1 Tax=Pseudomonas mangiferae TaxID=2593654 RepID=A0A553H505_9PSED|nr:beta-ketoacyl-ACP synthase 3 [Pseudomonas mangiferae]TRX76855.1 beta-ketoacyl-ACP synthase 3 [Pseudomonas mangiferae]
MGNPIIAGLGFSLPKRQVSNHDLLDRINTSDEFIVERTGVRTRYHVEPDQAVSALMVPAARQAIEAAGLAPDDIDLLLVNTLSPDHHDPSQACLIQPMLGLRHIPVLDIRAQCSGLLYGLQMARGQILAGLARHVLVVCGEVLSKRMDCSDRGRNLSILLGDGAGAAVVSAGEGDDDGLLDLRLGADGDYFDLLMTAAPGTASPTFLDEAVLREGGGEFLMRGRPMFEHASQTLVRIAGELLAAHDLTLDDVDHVICHQPNLRILDEVQARLAIPAHKFAVTVDRLGNMASASTPVTLAMYWPDIRPGERILILTYGSGATWGAALYRKPPQAGGLC